MQKEMIVEAGAPIIKKSKQSADEEENSLIGLWIRSLLNEHAKGPLCFPAKMFGTLLSKHILSKEAAAFISKRLKLRSEEIGEFCSKPFHVNDQFLATLDCEKKIAVVERATGKKVLTLEHSKKDPEIYGYNRAMADSEGTLILSVGGDRFAKIWEVNQGRCVIKFVDAEPIRRARFAELNDGSKIIITLTPSWIKVWALETGVLLQTFQHQNPENSENTSEGDGPIRINAMKLHENTGKILIAYESCDVEIRDLYTGSRICGLEHVSEIDFYTYKFSPCGSYLVTVIAGENDNRALQLWSTQTGRLLCTEPLQWRNRCKLSFDRTGKKLLIVHGNVEDSNDDNVALFCLEADQLREEYFFDLYSGTAQEATFNRAGDLLLLASHSAAEIRRVGDCKIVHRLLGHKNDINSVSFNMRGEQAVTGDSTYNEILIWSVNTGLCLHIIRSDNTQPLFVGNSLISFGFDTHLWFIESIDNFLSGLTFHQAFLINAIYEIIILRRLALLREVAQKCKTLLSDTTQDFVFDFQDKPQNIVAAYLALKEPIRAVMDPFVKLPGTAAVRQDENSASVAKLSGEDSLESEQSETQDSEESSALSSNE
jgi:hypothetical protein